LGERENDAKIIIIIIIQFGSILSTCKHNNSDTNYKISTSKKEKTTKISNKIKIEALYIKYNNNDNKYTVESQLSES
jgi:hypothetical protein